MALWKARVDFLLSVIELLFLALTVEVLQGKTCQTSLLSGEAGSLWAKISRGRGRPWGIFFGFYKTRHILLSDSANCTVLRAVILTQYWHVTDGWMDRQTDGIAIASTAFAMRALWRAVKTGNILTLVCFILVFMKAKCTTRLEAQKGSAWSPRLFQLVWSTAEMLSCRSQCYLLLSPKYHTLACNCSSRATDHNALNYYYYTTVTSV